MAWLSQKFKAFAHNGGKGKEAQGQVQGGCQRNPKAKGKGKEGIGRKYVLLDGAQRVKETPEQVREVR